MRWSLYIGKISGIKIFIHWTFLILIFWIVLSGFSQGNTVQQVLMTIAFVLTVFACIILHELGHAITAKQFNYKTRDIILLPIGGLARMEGLPNKPLHEFLVAIMGPAVNIVIGLVLFIALKVTGNFPAAVNVNDLKIAKGNFLFQLYSVNIFLALFNLIPAFPMDGGRVLRALLSIKLSRAKATRIAAYIGQIIAIVFVSVGFFYNPILIFVGLFVFLGAQAEANMEQTKVLLTNIKVRDVLMHHFSIVNKDEPLSKAVTLLLDSQDQSFIVKDDGEVQGTLSKKNIIEGLAKFGNDILIEKVMQKEIVTLHAEDNINDVVGKFSDGSHSLMPVFEGKEMIGVLNLENIEEFIQVQAALELGHKS